MRRFWWVNHKQTRKQEIQGGYLWSPRREANGARSQFYENCRLASPGDPILSFADARIAFVGIVADCAISAPKPDEFEKVGAHWSTEGWLLPVNWSEVPRPLTPKNYLQQIAPLLPKKYSPIKPESGNGNQKAYLAEIGEDLFEAIVAKVGFVNPIVPPKSSIERFINDIETTIESSVQNNPDLGETEKDQIIKARRGQGDFRDSLFTIEKFCRVTSISNPTLLVASHIRPWRSCSTGIERLDGFNGLLFAPHVDRLFDRGLISFSNDGMPIVSKRLPEDDLQKLGLADLVTRMSTPFKPEQKVYLGFHREFVFLGD